VNVNYQSYHRTRDNQGDYFSAPEGNLGLVPVTVPAVDGKNFNNRPQAYTAKQQQ
jgi:hypothetical protein